MEQLTRKSSLPAVFCIGLVFGLWINGAIPFLMIPTLGQALGTTVGWAQAFINEGWFSIYSHSFGYPEPAARSFGLVGVLTTALFMRLGIHGADAYSIMVALWLTVAFVSAYRIGRLFGAQKFIAVLGAVFWLSMPIVWAHAGYSMLSIGIALMPFYFLAALNLFLGNPASPKPSILHVGAYAAAALIAVFMDGYTFMMFAAGASLLWAFVALFYPELRKRSVTFSAPVHALSLALAYVLYTSYIGKSEYESHPIDFFRGWGLDLAFIGIPAQGQHWFADLLGLSQLRTAKVYFGDSSVWKTTFALPLIVSGAFGWLYLRRRAKIASGLVLLALFGFYMALGPSLKINSTKPELLQQTRPGLLSSSMPPELAVASTGNAWISEKLPGFKSMRASYRWSALGIFALWALLLLLVGRTDPKHKVALSGAFIFLIALNLPNLPGKLTNDTAYRKMFLDIDSELIAGLKKVLRPNEIVAFLPYRNDLIMNYIAPTVGIRTYNIGGDKNRVEAMKSWPATMKSIHHGQIDSDQIHNVLVAGDADVVVIPYFESLQAAHTWPCGGEAKYVSDEIKNAARFDCPSEIKSAYSPVVDTLKQISHLVVTDSDLFATVRVHGEFATEPGRIALKSKFLSQVRYPVAVQNPDHVRWVLSSGWHKAEANSIWSMDAATLNLPVPTSCQETMCAAVLKFSVFGASPDRPIAVELAAKNSESKWTSTVRAVGSDLYEVSVPLQVGAKAQEISIAVPGATSPLALSGSPDGRILGINLQDIKLEQGPLTMKKTELNQH
jgi:hypothetical protein